MVVGKLKNSILQFWRTGIKSESYFKDVFSMVFSVLLALLANICFVSFFDGAIAVHRLSAVLLLLLPALYVVILVKSRELWVGGRIVRFLGVIIAAFLLSLLFAICGMRWTRLFDSFIDYIDYMWSQIFYDGPLGPL